MNKKGNINELFPAVLTIILVGALMCVGILVMTGLQDVSYANTAATSTNESLAAPGIAGITLTTGNSARAGVCGALTGVYNATGAYMIGLTNFTQTGCTVVNATILGAVATNATTLKYTYPYTYDKATTTTDALNASNSTLVNVASTWIPIIIVVVAAGIVLAVLLGAFAGKRK